MTNPDKEMQMRKLGIIAVVVILMGVSIYTLSAKTGQAMVNIGAPGDTGGMIVHYLLNVKKFMAEEKLNDFKFYPTNDCCSSTSEWAMSTDKLDLAIMCPDSAEVLIQKDSRYEIVGPCLLNSDVIVLKPGIIPRKIAVTQKREYQQKLVKEKFGPNCTGVPMLATAVPYAYEKGVVDGAVADILSGLALKGDYLPAYSDSQDLVTYVLVVRKEFKMNPLYQEFILAYQTAVGELNNPDTLAKEVESYRHLKMTSEEVEIWQTMKLKLVIP